MENQEEDVESVEYEALYVSRVRSPTLRDWAIGIGLVVIWWGGMALLCWSVGGFNK